MKIIHTITTATLFFAQFIILVIIFALLIPARVVRVDNIDDFKPTIWDRWFTIIAIESPIKIVEEDRAEDGLPIISPGEPITINLKYKKFLDITSIHSRKVICDDGMIYTIGNEDEGYQPVGEADVITSYNILPNSAISGSICWLAFPGYYEVNSLNKVSVTPESERFIVK